MISHELSTHCPDVQTKTVFPQNLYGTKEWRVQLSGTSDSK